MEFLNDLLSSISDVANDRADLNKGRLAPKGYPVSPEDVAAMNKIGVITGVEPENIQNTLASGIAKAKEDQRIMDNLPDISGTNNILSKMLAPKQPLPDITEQPKAALVAETVAESEPKPVVKPKIAKNIPAANSEPLPDQPTKPNPIDELLKSAMQKPGPDAEMLAAQKKADENLGNYMLMKGAQQLGAGLGSTRPDENYMSDLKEVVNKPVTDIKEMRDLLSKQQKDQMDKTRFVLDTTKAKLELNDEMQRSDPKSDASMLARSSTRDALNRMGRTDLSSKINDNMSGEQLSKLFGTMTLSNMVTAYEAQQNRLAMAEAKADAARDIRKEKMDQKDAVRLDAAGKLISEDMARMNTPFGKNANLINTADRLEALIASKNPKDVTNQQIYEIARGLDGMVSMGASTIGGTTHLLPRGFMADMAVASEKLKNEPAGAGQAKFVTQAIETIRREREIAKKQIAKAAKGALGSYYDLSTKHPEAWNTMLQMKGINPALITNEPKREQEVPETASYSAQQETGIQAVMKNNNISREDAIKALKAAGKI